MSDKNTGGPAFPRSPFDQYDKAPEGMTLRDYFAGQALAGIMGGGSEYHKVLTEVAKENKISINQLIISYSVELADAMIAARDAEEVTT